MPNQRDKLKEIIVEVYQTAYNHRILDDDQANRFIKNRVSAILALLGDTAGGEGLKKILDQLLEDYVCDDFFLKNRKFDQAISAILALVPSVEEMMDIINENYNTNYGLATALHKKILENLNG